MRDALRHRIEHRVIQRMRHGGDELARGVARQLGIGIERDHVAHCLQRIDIADDRRKHFRRAAAHQAVQIGQLAALALVTHPDTFNRIPFARSVQQQERPAADLAIGTIQLCDDVAGVGQQCDIAVNMFGRRVGEVGQQTEAQLRVAIRQETHLERFGQIFDVQQAGQQRGYHHQGRKCRRNAGLEIHLRQRSRRSQHRDDPVHQRQRQVTAGDHRRYRKQRQQPWCQVLLPADCQQQCSDARRDQQHRAEIKPQRGTRRCTLGRAKTLWLHPRALFEFGQAVVDQVVADMGTPVRYTVCCCGQPRQRDGFAGDLGLGQRRAFGDFFDYMTVMVTGGEIHLRIYIADIVAQNRFDHTHGLDKLAPVHCTQKAQAADAVGNRHLVSRLLLAFLLYQLLDGGAGLGQALRHPGEG